MLEQHTRSQCDLKIRMGYADVVRAFDLGDQLFPMVVERAGIDFTRDEEVRDGGPALRSAFGHQAAEGAGDFDAGGFLGNRIGCNRSEERRVGKEWRSR